MDGFQTDATGSRRRLLPAVIVRAPPAKACPLAAANLRIIDRVGAPLPFALSVCCPPGLDVASMVFSLAFLIRFLFHDDEAHWLLRFLGGIERSDENPTIDLLDRLAKTLGVPLAELFVERKVKYGKPAELRRGRKAK